MMRAFKSERYANKIRWVLSFLNRISVTGTIRTICYPKGMTGYLYQQRIPIFDSSSCADRLREEIRVNLQKSTSKDGLEIEYIRKNTFRRENRIKNILQERGDAPDLIHIFSATESCASYKSWHDKKTHEAFLNPIGQVPSLLLSLPYFGSGPLLSTGTSYRHIQNCSE